MRKELPFVYHRGQIVPAGSARLHTDSEAFKFGNVVTEQALACWSADDERHYAFRLADHCRRCWESMRITRLPHIYAADHIERATLEVIVANLAAAKGIDVAIRYIVYRGLPDDGPDGVGLTIQAFGRPALSLRSESAPIRAMISSWTRLPDHVMPARARSSGKRANARYARQEAAARGYDDALMLNWHGKVADFTDSCAFFVRRGRVVTPSARSDILESITRETCIRLLQEAYELKVEEREVDPSELYVLDEAWQGDAIEGLRAVVSIDDMHVGQGRPGPLFRGLHRTFCEAHYGRADPSGWQVPMEWCMPVVPVREYGA